MDQNQDVLLLAPSACAEPFVPSPESPRWSPHNRPKFQIHFYKDLFYDTASQPLRGPQLGDHILFTSPKLSRTAKQEVDSPTYPGLPRTPRLQHYGWLRHRPRVRTYS